MPLSAQLPDRDERRRLLPYAGKYVRATGRLFERSAHHVLRNWFGLLCVAQQSDTEGACDDHRTKRQPGHCACSSLSEMLIAVPPGQLSTYYG